MACEPRDGDSGTLLGANDPPPVEIVNPNGASPLLFIGDHAGNRMPAALGTLGLGAADRDRHIAWDIGVGALGERLAARLDATFIRQAYSRLVVDCNRAPDAPDAIAAISDGTAVPGNTGLTPADRAARFADIHEPYQRAIAAELSRRDAAGRGTTLIALHSFTPTMNDVARPWQIGVLHDRGDTSLAVEIVRRLRADGRWNVGDNEPYQMDSIDYTIPRHAYPAHRRYVEFEIRQDLIATAGGQAAWADHLTDLLADIATIRPA